MKRCPCREASVGRKNFKEGDVDRRTCAIAVEEGGNISVCWGRQGSNTSILDSTTAERCSPSMMAMEKRVTCHYFCKYSSDSQ